MTAHEVPLTGGTGFVKVRSPVWVVVWTIMTLGIYGAYWWYQVNREMRDLGRARQRTDLGDSPGTSLIAVTLGLLVIIPPFVSLWRGCRRVQVAQGLAGIEERERLNGWIAGLVTMTGFLILVPLVIAFVQSELNKAWRSESITDDPAGLLGRDIASAPQPVSPAQAGPAPAAPPLPGPDPQLERLEHLAALRDSGALTPEEYEAQKAKILAEL